MYTLVEIWTPKAQWLQAPLAERQAFMNGVGGAMQQLTAAGVEIVCWCKNDPDTSHRSEHGYFAVWRFPSLDVARLFEGAVQASGWYDYFEHRNLRGVTSDPPTIIGEHMAL